MRPRSLLGFDSCTALSLALFYFPLSTTAQSPWWNPAVVADDSPAITDAPTAANSWDPEAVSAQFTAATSLPLQSGLTASWQTWETWSHWSEPSSSATPTSSASQSSTWSPSSSLPSSSTTASSSSSSSSSSTSTRTTPTSSPTHTVMAKGSKSSASVDTRNKYAFSDKGLAILIGVIIIGAAVALLAAAMILVHLRKKYTGSYFKAAPDSMHSSLNGGSEGDAESLHNEKAAANVGAAAAAGGLRRHDAARDAAARDEAAQGGPWFGGMLHHQTSQNSFSNSVLAAVSRVSTPDPARLAHQESQKVLIQEDAVVEDGLHPVERPVSRASYTEADNLLTAAGRPQELEGGGGGGAAHTPASELDGAWTNREGRPEAAAAAAAAIAANTNHSSPDYPASHDNNNNNPHDSSAWPHERASTPLTAVPVHGNVANDVSAHTYPPYHPVSSSHAPLQAPSTHDLPLLPSSTFVPPPRPQSRPLVVMQSPTSTTSSERYPSLYGPNPNGMGTTPYNLDDADLETNFTCDSTTNLQTPHASFWNRDRWIVPPNPNSPSYLNDTRRGGGNGNGNGGVSPLPGRETFNSSPGTPGHPNGYPRQSSPLLHQRAGGGYRDISPSSSEFLPTPRPDQPRPDRSRRDGKAAVLCPTWGELSGFDFDGAAVVERTQGGGGGGGEGEDGEDGWRPVEAADGRYELM